MANTKRIADLSTRFRVEGLDTLRAGLARAADAVRGALAKMGNSPAGKAIQKSFDVARKGIEQTRKSIQKATDGLKKMGEMARKTGEHMKRAGEAGKKIAMAGVAGVGAVVAGGTSAIGATKAQASEVLEAEKLGRGINMSTMEMSAFGKIAREVGIDIGGAQQMMAKFNDAASQAQRGEGFQAQFKGVNTKITQSRREIDVLNDFARKWAKMAPGRKRDKFLGDIFGNENLAEADELMARLTRTQTTLRQEMEALEKSGTVFDERDLQNAKGFRSATNALSESFRGLRQAIFRTFGPTVNRLILVTARLLQQNTGRIVGGMIQTWNYAIRVIRTFFGWQQKVGSQDVGWVVMLKNAFYAIGPTIDMLRTRFSLFVEGVKANFEIARAYVSQFIRDVRATMFGRDYDVSGQNRWMLSIRDQALRVVSAIQASFTQLYGAATEAFGGIAAAWAEVVAGFQAAEFGATETAFHNIGAAVGIVIQWVVELTKQIYLMAATGADATGGFEWLNTVRDWIQHTVDAATVAIGWFKQLWDSINAVVGIFGTDLSTALLFLALLRLTGVGGILASVISGFGGIITKVISLVSNFGVAGKAATLFAGRGGLGILVAALGFGGPLALAIGLLVSNLDLIFGNLQQHAEETKLSFKEVGDAALAATQTSRQQKLDDPSLQGSYRGSADMRSLVLPISRQPEEERAANQAARIAHLANPAAASGQGSLVWDGSAYVLDRSKPPAAPTTNLNITVGDRIIETQTNSTDAEIRKAFAAANLRPS